MCNRFQTRRYNSATYICDCCGKRTRETGNDESKREMCLACDLEGEIQNMISDYSHKISQEQVDRFMYELRMADANTADADTKAIVAIHKRVMEVAYA